MTQDTENEPKGLWDEWNQHLANDELHSVLSHVEGEDLHSPSVDDSEFEDEIETCIEQAREELRRALRLRAAELAMQTLRHS